VCSAPSARVFLPANQTTAGNVGERGSLAIAQGNINVLAPPSPSSAQESSHDTIAGIKASRQVRYSNSDLDRGAIAASCNVHEAKLSLHHHIVASALRIRTSLAISRDGGVNELGIDLVDGGKVELVLGQGSWEVILNQDVAFRSELMENCYTCRILER
jgi:hypothetical protein